MSTPPSPAPLTPNNPSAGLVLDRDLLARLAALGTRKIYAPRSVVSAQGHGHAIVHLVLSGVLQVLVHEKIGIPLNTMRLAMWNMPPLPPSTPMQRRLMGYVPAPPPAPPTPSPALPHAHALLREAGPYRRLDRLKLDCSGMEDKDGPKDSLPAGLVGRSVQSPLVQSPLASVGSDDESSEGLMGFPQGARRRVPGAESTTFIDHPVDDFRRTEQRPDVFRVTSSGQDMSSILSETFFRPSAMASLSRFSVSGNNVSIAPHVRKSGSFAPADTKHADSGKPSPKRVGAKLQPRSPNKVAASNKAPAGSPENDILSNLSERRANKELVVGVLGPGEFVGEMGIFVPALPRDLLVRAATRTEVVLIPHDVFLTALQGELASDALRIMYAIGHQLARRLMLIEHRASAMAFLDVGDRVLRTVMELVYGVDALSHPDGTQIRVSRQELARLSGCSREMAGRALKDLEDRGVLSADGKTIVVFGVRGPEE